MTGRVALPLTLTLGEPAGIGPDVTLLAWARRREEALPPFHVVGDPEFLRRRARRLGLDTPIRAVDATESLAVFDEALPVVDLGRPVTGEPGHPSPGDAPAVVASIEAAVEEVRLGLAAAVVTNPIHKHALYAAGFAHPGHTEFLGDLAGRFAVPVDGGRWRPVMMLAGPDLRTVPITVHVALSRAVHELTTELIVETARIVDADLRARFGLARPRLVVAGLNPHAGEDGAMGLEEIEVMRPAIAALVAEGIDVRGPLPADTLFHARARASYDAALCPTHDQALIPVKTIAFDETVNVTLGLPFVRTSPDHGTALDIAGGGRAHPGSLMAALRMAAAMSGGR
ncbi:MAG: 4-hydroxythreonine-4-phosphate dehydrogenase PdxA [Siculibacillus sp.]|nr:4-hydroxythreonine-4-phosphate dehydrogenase PdxA [Siculibacillus sp.]